MMTQFLFEEPEFRQPGGDAVADQRRAYAAEVMADLAGTTEDSLPSLQPELPVEAAVACGNCRLYAGVNPQIVFPGWLAVAAAERLVGLVDRAAADAARLPDLWGDATGDEAEDVVAGLIHARMDSWAAILQLDDVAEHVADDAARQALATALARLDEALERFDRALDTRQEYLSLLAGTNLLANLRAMLAPQFRDPLPWWLDGRLEAQAEAIDARIDELADEVLYEPAAGRRATPATATRTLGGLRDMVTQIYAAAAATHAAVESGVGRLRWRSPDGRACADLVPPVARQAAPARIVLDFTDASGRPALDLVGSRCALAGVETVLASRRVDGEDRAVADFSGATLFADVAAAGDRPLTLVVEPAGEPWTLLVP
jgi:hypothetical protein